MEVASDNSRRGHAGFSIRGIGGNRILMMVDGVRVPEAYEGGGTNGAVSGRDMVEPDTLRQVDIVKGPYSALYGSDALGGVVNMVTYSPRDFVDAEKCGHIGLKYGWRSRDRSHGATATLAGFHENAEGLLMFTRRRGTKPKTWAKTKATPPTAPPPTRRKTKPTTSSPKAASVTSTTASKPSTNASTAKTTPSSPTAWAARRAAP